MLHLCLFSTGCFGVMMSCKLRRVSLQEQAEGAGSTSLFPSSAVELVLPLAMAIHLFSSLSKKGQPSPAVSGGGTSDTLTGQCGMVGCEQSGLRRRGWSAGLPLWSLVLVDISNSSKLVHLLGSPHHNTSSPCPSSHFLHLPLAMSPQAASCAPFVVPESRSGAGQPLTCRLASPAAG